MKKVVTTIGILLLAVMVAAPVFAHRWGRGGYSGEPGPCCRDQGSLGNMTESQRAELDKLERQFRSDTTKYRDEIRSKSAELDTLLNSPDLDVNKAKALQKEISDLRAKMDEHRLSVAIETRKIAPELGSGRGHGWKGHHGQYGHHGACGHYGPHHYGHGHGYGPCWN